MKLFFQLVFPSLTPIRIRLMGPKYESFSFGNSTIPSSPSFASSFRYPVFWGERVAFFLVFFHAAVLFALRQHNHLLLLLLLPFLFPLLACSLLSILIFSSCRLPFVPSQFRNFTCTFARRHRRRQFIPPADIYYHHEIAVAHLRRGLPSSSVVFFCNSYRFFCCCCYVGYCAFFTLVFFVPFPCFFVSASLLLLCLH